MTKRPSDPQKRRLIKLDEQFREWVKLQPSCVSGTFSEWHDGIGFSIACHVRRASNAGTGYKPLFSCVPLTDAEHKLTHQQGETALRPEDWFEDQAQRYFALWRATVPPQDRALLSAL